MRYNLLRASVAGEGEMGLARQYFFLFACLLVFGQSPASATLITEKVTFNVTGFPSGAPQNPVSGDVTLTFDPSSTIDTTAGVDAINLSIDGHTYLVTSPRMVVRVEC